MSNGYDIWYTYVDESEAFRLQESGKNFLEREGKYLILYCFTRFTSKSFPWLISNINVCYLPINFQLLLV